MRLKLKELKQMRGKEIDFFRIYGMRPTSQQLAKFAPPKRVAFTDKDYRTIEKTVPQTLSAWRRHTTNEH